MYSLDLSKLGFDLKGRMSGKIKTTCPKCSETRKKSKEPCALVDIDNGIYKCYNCDYKGTVQNERRTYTKPAANKNLPDSVYEFFKKRGIDRSTVIAFGSQVAYRPAVFFPGCAQNKPAIAYQYLLGGEHVRTKFKSKDKDYTSENGGMIIPYNFDSCAYKDYVIITEGEEECMSWHQAGKTSVISAPNGANENLEWLDAVYDFIQDKRVFIAVDMDEPGRKLQAALIRRFDKENTFLISFPLKDANDTLVEYGEDYLVNLFDTARPVPIPEIAELSDFENSVDTYRKDGFPSGWSAELSETDSHIQIDRKDFGVLTATPAAGKTTWTRWYLMNIAKQNGLKIGVCSFENPKELWVAEAVEQLTGKELRNCNDMEYDAAKRFIAEHFVFFDTGGEMNYALDSILSTCKSMIRRHGVDLCVIDPWNYVQIEDKDSTTEAVGNALRKCKRFCVTEDVAIICIAHPRKMDKEGDGNYKVPTPYDIYGSNAWFNTCDFCLALHRNYMDDNAPVDLYVQKAKWRWRMRLGRISYHYSRGYYTEGDGPLRSNFLGTAKQAAIFEE